MRRTELLLCVWAAGCSFAPPLTIPDIPTAGGYKEEAPWTPAQPADAVPRDAWWSVYRDPGLDALQQRLIAGSPDLAAALARYEQTRAVADQLRSGLLPALAGTASGQRIRQSEGDAYTSRSIGVEASYELDLWGRVRNQVASGRASERAAQADLESARLSLQAQLADTYIALRGADREIALFNETVTAYDRALELTTTRHDGGIASGLDVARARTQLESARAQVAQVHAQRAVLEHAIAALVGESASSFSIAPRVDPIALPRIPPGVPSVLLQRRPDIAAAQRRMAAANADIGVARAAYFPAVTLGAGAGYLAGASGSLIAAPNLYWSVGPSLFVALFDAGKRRAQVAQAQAVLDEAGARYRGVVLGAFQQVEDNLALLRQYRIAALSEEAAVASAQRSLAFATSRYRDGAANYLEVTASQTASLQAQRDALDIDTRERRASVQLIKALGGGWQAE